MRDDSVAWYGQRDSRALEALATTKEERMVLSNLRLVAHVVLRMRCASNARRRRFVPDLDDLIQDGVLGLMRAAGWTRKDGSQYDAARGAFTTYAYSWIRQHAQRSYETGGCRYGSTRTMGEARLLAGADRIDWSSGGLEPAARGCGHEDQAETAEETGILLRAIGRLPPRSADILGRRWGLGDRPKETLMQVAAVYGICKERVRQIEQKAIKSMATLIAKERAMLKNGGDR